MTAQYTYLKKYLNFCDLLGRFTIQNIVPQSDGDSSKVKVKVRVNVHGIFSVSSASLIEKQKGEAEDMQMEMEPSVQNESRQEEQVEKNKASFFSHPEQKYQNLVGNVINT